MSWDDYLLYVNNAFNQDEGAYRKTQISEACGLFAQADGQQYAANEGFTLHAAPYSVSIPTETGDNQDVSCNEFAALAKCVNEGVNKGGQECGIRVNNHKFMFLRKTEMKVGQGSYTGDADQVIEYWIFSCGPYVKGQKQGKGGMVVAKTNTLFVIGKYDSEMVDSTGGNQNVGDVSAAVAFCAAVLKNSGS